MKKVNLNLYESSYPLEDIKSLWADVDENTGELKAIHKYDTGAGEWQPYLVSLAYLGPNPESPYWDSYTDRTTGIEAHVHEVDNVLHVCIIGVNWDNVGTVYDESLEEIAVSPIMQSTVYTGRTITQNAMFSFSGQMEGKIEEFFWAINRGDKQAQIHFMTQKQYNTFKVGKPSSINTSGNLFNFFLMIKVDKKGNLKL